MISLSQLLAPKPADPKPADLALFDPRRRKGRRSKERARAQVRRRIWRKARRATKRMAAQPIPLEHQHAAQRRRAGMDAAARRAALEAAKHVSLRGSRRRKRSTR